MKIRPVLCTTMTMPNCGGLCTHVRILQTKLKERRCEPFLIDGQQTDSIFRKLLVALHAGLLLREPRTEWIKKRALLIKREIRRLNGFDLIHAHDPIAAVAAMGLGVPVLLTSHGPMLEHAKEVGGVSANYLRVLQEYEEQCIGGADYFIAVDSGQKELLVKKGAKANKIKVIYNAVDVDQIQSIAARDNSYKGTYFVMARRLVPKNGSLVGIEAFLEWVDRRDIKLLVAGDGPQRRQIEELLNERPNGNKVHLLGMLPQDELLPLMKGAIGSLVPSVPVHGVIEATSLTALECLALDVPVIASNIGGLTEIDRNNGVLELVPPGDKQALMHKMEFLTAHRRRGDLRLSQHVRSHFGAESWIEKHLQIYKALLGE